MMNGISTQDLHGVAVPSGIRQAVGNAIEQHLIALDGKSPAELRQQRRERFLAIGRLDAAE